MTWGTLDKVNYQPHHLTLADVVVDAAEPLAAVSASAVPGLTAAALPAPPVDAEPAAALPAPPVDA